MVKKERGPTDPNVASLIIQLRKASSSNEVSIWRDLSKRLLKPRRNRSEVNVSKINRYSKENGFVVVPGKVLGSGEMDHPVTVAALSFSEGARTKIAAANGKTILIAEMMEMKPDGKDVRIIG